jgi:alpha-tubulin suppressor-like RCC1 family protein
VPLSDPAGIVELSGGVEHACAISDTSQQLYCWGDNYSGQLGDGTKNDSSVPLQILRPALAVSVTDNVTCAIGVARPDETRSLLCWGYNYYGQLGNGSNVDSANPVVVLDPTGMSSLKNIVAVSVGEFSACAIDSDGHAYCWGFNGYGQLGDGIRNNSTLPVAVKSPDGSGQLEDVVEISTGYRHACARKSDGTVLCWGKDEGSGIGDGGTRDRLLPVVIDFDTIFSDGFEQN